jgi:chemotaxis protein methyltransferase CheR
MRNVLIYFEADTKKTILEKVLKVLKPGGYLFLGSGEAPVGLEDRFQPTDFSISACFKLAPA